MRDGIRMLKKKLPVLAAVILALGIGTFVSMSSCAGQKEGGRSVPMVAALDHAWY